MQSRIQSWYIEEAQRSLYKKINNSQDTQGPEKKKMHVNIVTKILRK